MAIQLTTNTTIVTRNTITNKTINTPFVISYTTSGSNMFSSTMNVTSSWTLIDQNQNKDFLFGAFVNMDATSSILLAVGNTASIALTLTPYMDTSTLVWSGSTNLYAKSTGSNASPQLDYTLVSMN